MTKEQREALSQAGKNLGTAMSAMYGTVVVPKLLSFAIGHEVQRLLVAFEGLHDKWSRIILSEGPSEEDLVTAKRLEALVDDISEKMNANRDEED